MLIELHPHCEQPPDAAVVWRYMDLPKLLDLLITKKLYLSGPSGLNDPHEGTATRVDVEKSDELEAMYRAAGLATSASGASFLAGERHQYFVNCWCLGSRESQALWRIYAGEKGVAIKTTYSRLMDSLAADFSFHIGKVKYIDRNEHRMASANGIEYCMHKSVQYDYENEVRIVVPWWRIERNRLAVPPAGIKMDLSVETLAPTIVVSPMAEDWYFNVVRQIVATLHPSMPVEWSAMHHPPYLPKFFGDDRAFADAAKSLRDYAEQTRLTDSPASPAPSPEPQKAP